MIIEIENCDCLGCIYDRKDGTDGWINECSKQHKCVPQFRSDGRIVIYVDKKISYSELSRRAHDNAVKHGFWDNEERDEHYLMLAITEVAEIVEADRKDNYFTDADAFEKYAGQIPFDELFERYVKNTVEDEMADIAIRLYDLAGNLNVEIPLKRPRWSFSKLFTLNAYRLCQILTFRDFSTEEKVIAGIHYIESWAAYLGKNLEWHIVQKMRYNENRPCRYGKKY